jgi:hypothetical protein
VIWSRAFANGLLCEWRAWPNGGFVLAPDRRTEGWRTRQSLVIAAGPITDLIVLWSVYQLIQHAFGGLGASFSHGAGGLMLFAFFWLTVLVAFGGLVPRQVSIGPDKMWTDGYLLLRLWTGGARFPQLAYNSNWQEALDGLQAANPRGITSLEAGERELPAHRAGPATFHEQRSLLGSRLLRRPPFTSGPPV